MISKMNKLFVYGSLKRNYWNNSILSNGKYHGKAQTLPVFTLLRYSSFPAVIPDGNTAIKGEIWEIDDATLSYCDYLEGHPNFYKRIKITTDMGEAWMYCMNPKEVDVDCPIIESGEWNG